MRAGEVTRLYHHQTNQCRGGRPPGVPRFVPMDPSNRPQPFKRHLGTPVHPLPRDLPPTGAPAAVTLSGRVPPSVPTIDGELLARLLFYSAGVTRTAGDNLWFRAAPSAGNLHPLEMYAVASEVAGLDAGLYHFATEVFGLEALAAGDHRPALADATTDPDVGPPRSPSSSPAYLGEPRGSTPNGAAARLLGRRDRVRAWTGQAYTGCRVPPWSAHGPPRTPVMLTRPSSHCTT